MSISVVEIDSGIVRKISGFVSATGSNFKGVVRTKLQ